MPVGYCPVSSCDKAIDIDGFSEHGAPTLWYCLCGRVFTHGPDFCQLTEIPKSEVDLTGNFFYGVPGREPRPGEFIIALRWKRVREVAHTAALNKMAEFVPRARGRT